MADNVIIVQQTNRDGTKLLAPKVPEAAVYDAEGKLLSVKINDFANKSDIWVTPQMFGAKADGVTDDYAAITEAMEHHYVYFPKGDYKISNYLKPNSNSVLDFHAEATLSGTDATSSNQLLRIWQDTENITLRCNGALFQGNTGSTASVIYIYGGKHINIFDCNIKANGAGQDGITVGVRNDTKEAASNIVISGGKITQMGRAGIAVTGGKNVVIENMEIYGIVNNVLGCSVDIEANVFCGSGDITVRNCYFHDDSRAAVFVAFGRNVLIENCICENNNQEGSASYADIGAGGFGKLKHTDIGGTEGVHYISLTGIDADGTIHTDNVGALHEGSIVVFPDTTATVGTAKINSTWKYATNINATDNTFKLLDYIGGEVIDAITVTTVGTRINILTEDICGNVTIRNNTIRKRPESAGGIIAECTLNTVIENNRIECKDDTKAYQLMAINTDYAIIRGNKLNGLYGTKGFGIKVLGTANTIEDCEFIGCSSAILTKSAQCHGLKVFNCVVTGCKFVVDAKGKDYHFRNVKVLSLPSAASAGINVANTTGGAIIENCDITGCKVQGTDGYNLGTTDAKVINSIGRDGSVVNVDSSKAGTTANRPTSGIYIGWEYFDTTLGKPVYAKTANGSQWVDATGTVV